MMFDSILVITRPKKNGIGTHFGVQFSEREVYDYTYEDGFRRTTIDAFADGADVTITREIPWHMAHVVRRRLDELARDPRAYDLLTWNCETFAEWLTSGVPRSSQVLVALALLGIAAITAAAK